MIIGTWNVNGIRARQAQVLDWIASDEPDVVALQELKAKSEQVPEALSCLAGYWCFWHGAGPHSGVSLQLRRSTFPAEPRFEHPDFDMQARIVVAEAGGTVFASVYVPNGGTNFPAKIEFLHRMSAWVRAVHASGKSLVLCGDLNVARTDRDVHPKERRPVTGQLPEERAILEEILGGGLVDVGRALAPDADDMFTWWAPWRNMRQRNIGWRLDYVLASAPLAATAISCPVRRDVGTSDHAPVVATFA